MTASQQPSGIPSPDDIPRARAEAFAIVDEIDTSTGKTHIVLGIEVLGLWVSYTFPLDHARQLHEMLGRELSNHETDT